MLNVDAIILGDDPSQTAPLCNGTAKELIDEIKKLRSAVEFYADVRGGLWEPCVDDHENGLRRLYITGTAHPNTVARTALGIK